MIAGVCCILAVWFLTAFLAVPGDLRWQSQFLIGLSWWCMQPFHISQLLQWVITRNDHCMQCHSSQQLHRGIQLFNYSTIQVFSSIQVAGFSTFPNNFRISYGHTCCGTLHAVHPYSFHFFPSIPSLFETIYLQKWIFIHLICLSLFVDFFTTSQNYDWIFIS